MVLLVTGSACGLLAFWAAVTLQFQLPLWQSLCGLRALGTEKRSNIDIPRLRRRLSVLFYFLAFGFLGGSLILDLKLVSASVILPLFFVLILLVYDGVIFFWCRFDRNTYDKKVRRASRLLVLAVNLLLLLLTFTFLSSASLG